MKRLLAIGLAAALIASPPAAAQEASLPDIEDEVMCPICGTLLELSAAPQAEREREFIRELIADGASKEEIKDALVAEYGSEVLATPGDSGFDLSAYLVPIAAFALALLAVGAAGVRWRRRGDGEDGELVQEPSAEQAQRLRDDMARYDL
jgi:cytochrome c-type biogenesis protein CcmH